MVLAAVVVLFVVASVDYAAGFAVHFVGVDVVAASVPEPIAQPTTM